MKIARILLFLGVSVGFFVFACGCEETGQAGDRQARLIANENLQLHKEIESLNDEVQNQKELLAKCEKEKAAIAAAGRSRKFDEAVSEMLEKSSKKVGELIKENMELREKIKTLGGQVE